MLLLAHYARNYAGIIGTSLNRRVTALLFYHMLATDSWFLHYNSQVLNPDCSIPLKSLSKMINLHTFQFSAHPLQRYGLSIRHDNKLFYS